MLSRIVSKVAPSAIGDIFNKATKLRAAGADLIDLSVGEPAFETPAHIRQAAHTAIETGMTRYTSVDGTSELKDAVIRKFERDNGLHFTRNQIVVASGAKPLLAVAMQTILDPGDEVVLPAPCWTSHLGMIQACGARPVLLPCHPDEGFKLRPDALRAALTDRTRLLILTSPANPTGSVYSSDELAALATVLRETPDVLVISDDLYEKIVFSPTEFSTLAAVAPGLSDRVMTVNGVSKAYAMTGWRIGYCGAPEWWTDGMRTLLSQVAGSPCSVSQVAAIAALDGPQDFLQEWARTYRNNQDVALAELHGQDMLKPFRADGAFYLIADCSSALGQVRPGGTVIEGSGEFCRYLLGAGVVAVPGTAFQADNLVRFSMAVSENEIREGMNRIRSALSDLKPGNLQ